MQAAPSGPEAIWQALLRDDPALAGLAGLYAPVLAPPDSCFVLGRIAQSLDGRIAATGGNSFWISGQADINHTHRLRALCDAVVVGAGTVRADDPLLTTRHCPGPSPLRVVIDPARRLGAGFRVFQDGRPTLLLCTEGGAGRLGTAEVAVLPRADDGGIDLAACRAEFAARGLRRVLVEGGGRTVSRFLAAGALDRLHVTVAPLLLGSGVPAFSLPEVTRPEDGHRLAYTLHRLGADLLFDIALP